MKYVIADRKKAEEYGFSPVTHMLTREGTMMVLNENELRRINADIDTAASAMGAVVMTRAEAMTYINKTYNDKEETYK